MAKKPTHTEELIELYVLGSLPPEEARNIEAASMKDPVLRAEIDALRTTMEKWATLDAKRPPVKARDQLLQRVAEIEASRTTDEPPFLNAASRMEDYVRWSIGKSEDTTTYLVKMCSGIPPETHTDEIERIMILQGECEFVVGEERLAVGPGDQFAIPLYLTHSATLTGTTPCLFLVQRTKISA
jgi:mannose-6-phosphate isomerase-like protein (cupin superfamily)